MSIFGLPVYVIQRKFTNPIKHKFQSTYWKNWEKFHYYTISAQQQQLLFLFLAWHEYMRSQSKNLLRKQQIIRFFQLVAWTLSFSHAKSATKTKGTENLWAASWWWWWWWRMNEWMNEWQSSQEGEQKRGKRSLCKVLVGSEVFRRILLITHFGPVLIPLSHKEGYQLRISALDPYM